MSVLLKNGTTYLTGNEGQNVCAVLKMLHCRGIATFGYHGSAYVLVSTPYILVQALFYAAIFMSVFLCSFLLGEKVKEIHSILEIPVNECRRQQALHTLVDRP